MPSPQQPSLPLDNDLPEIRHDWTYAQVRALFDLPFFDLMYKAMQTHQAFFDPNAMQIATLLSIKTGACPEDCAYCPQSAYYSTGLERESLLNTADVMVKAKNAKDNGATRFCMGAAWKNPPREKEFNQTLEMVAAVKDLGLETCMTLGMLTADQAARLKSAGLDFYNHNLDTSPEYYEKIITTRTYQDRLDTLEHVRNANLKVCCGGIIGMGEKREDRINFLLQLANLPEHPESVPINKLITVKGTPLGETPEIDAFEFIRVIALARLMMPKSFVRLTAGRESMNDEMQALCFLAGANSIFYGEKLLTRANPAIDHDNQLLEKLGIKHFKLDNDNIEKNLMVTQRLQKALLQQRTKQLYRTLDRRDSGQGAVVIYQGKSYLSFCSNDYLGLANHPEVIKAFKDAADLYGVGSGASHLLSGHCSVHHSLEEELAEFLAYPAVLLFSTGYMANLGAINTFAKQGDLLIQDHNNHASLIDAGLLANAEMRRYRHNDCTHLQKILETTTHKNKFIVTQGIFSMSGELAPLPEIMQLAKTHQAWLMVDDAHGLGCLGETGRGTIEHHHLTHKDVPILIGTLGKAFGSFGAFIAGDHSSIEALRQFARTYIYTTALPPAVCAATRASLSLAKKENWRRLHLKAIIEEFRRGAQQLGLNILPSITAVQSLKVGDESKALELSNRLLAKGILIKAIRCPTVALGHACLRISLSAAHTSQHIAQLLEALNGL